VLDLIFPGRDLIQHLPHRFRFIDISTIDQTNAKVRGSQLTTLGVGWKISKVQQTNGMELGLSLSLANARIVSFLFAVC